MSKLLHIDCVGGVAGDMLIAALLDSGCDEQIVCSLAKRLGFDDVTIDVVAGRSGGFACKRVNVGFDESCHPHARGFEQVCEIIDRGDVSPTAARAARRIFERLAVAEARVHGATIDRVHFHEVGAVDAIIDIVAVCELLETLEWPAISFGSLPMGRGFVKTAHGRLPLPVPAVAELLIGHHIHDAAIEGETVTPTGLAILATLGKQQLDMPAMQVLQSGVGAGTREQKTLPNIVRVFFGGGPSPRFVQHEGVGRQETLFELRCTLDDCEPRVLAYALEACLQAGALDTYVAPVVMKRGRSGHEVCVLTRDAQRETIAQLLFRETTTLGVRIMAVERCSLERADQLIATRYGDVSVKLALHRGEVIRANPELSDCQKLARAHGVPLQQVIAEAKSAFDARLGEQQEKGHPQQSG
jgi:uncharacterized protein (TIGR00299 family) protein